MAHASRDIMISNAVSDLKAYDLTIAMIGSRALELASEDSNVNVLITMPLKALVKAIQEQSPTVFCLVDQPRWSRVNSLQIVHVSTGVELELVSRWSADIMMRERDDLMRIACEHHDLIAPFLRLVGAWYSRHVAHMPEEDGFPSRYVFRLIGVHFLMARVLGPLLPPFASSGPFLDPKHKSWKAAKKASGVTAEDLFVEWIRKMVKSDKRGLSADWRNPYEEPKEGKERWRVVDPAFKEEIHNFSLKETGDKVPVPRVIAEAAKRELAAREAGADAQK